ncbi:MAG: hypothetical protein B6D35_07510 [Candidatus Brocadia sp. UTAMX2]|jgi:4-amino-4-deoxy-L-arabinose transferase-like glycosyltransferase|nr:MAG: hypothetical protein B6D35_07510 [Candidatus Brocadia sp. UTAMX2]
MNQKENVITDKILWILLLLACAIRLYIWYVTPIISTDGISYINTAKHFVAGNFYEGLKHAYHPLYPLFISALSVMGIGFETAGRLVSLCFGTLSVAAVYFFGKKMFDLRIAVVSAILLAFHPYAARLSANVRCDAMYFFFYLLGFGLGYLALTLKESYLFFFAGIASAFAYLTRPEGVGILLIVSLWMGIQFITRERSAWRNYLKKFCLLLVGFFIFSSPYLLYLRDYTNSWTLTQKKQISDMSGITAMSDMVHNFQQWKINEVNNTPWDDFSYDKVVPERDAGKQGLHPVHTTTVKHTSGTKYFQSLCSVLNEFIITIHYPFVIFFIIGIMYVIKNKRKKTVNFYIASYLVLFLLILYFLKLTTGYAGHRHLLNVILITLFWTGIGISNTYSWLIKKIPLWQPAQAENILSRSGIIFLCLIVTFFLPKTLKSFKSEGIYKDAGIWIRTFYSNVPAVLTDDSIITFYAGVQRLKIPKKNTYEEIIAYARANNVDLIAVTDDIVEYDQDFFSKINPHDLKELYRGTAKMEKVVIYQVLRINEQRSSAKLHTDEKEE